MADLKITDLTAQTDLLTSSDLFMVVDASDTSMSTQGTNKKLAANRVAMTGATPTQTFTGRQIITPDTTGTCLTINVPDNNTTSFGINVAGADNGASTGSGIQIGRNTNASTPAAGYIKMIMMGGSSRSVWVDDSGLFRIHTAVPTNASDTAGTVVGDQTSALLAKELSEEPETPIKTVMERIATGAAAVKKFVYKSGAYNGQEFEGVIVDDAPAYGQDKDAEFPAGKSLNVIGILGDLLRAVADLDARVEALEA